MMLGVGVGVTVSVLLMLGDGDRGWWASLSLDDGGAGIRVGVVVG